MSARIDVGVEPRIPAETSLECDFPAFEISQLAEQESWRKEINRPIYHIHKWWATRLGSVFRGITLGALSKPGISVWDEFYKTHNFTDKVVLDPFMGSGTTLGEALKLGAKAVGCDINPVSTFLVRQAFTSVSESALREAFARLEKSVAHKIRRFYQTLDPETRQPIPVLYYFWVKTVDLPDGEVVPLLSRYVFSQDAYPKKKPKAQILCAHCGGVFEGRYDAVQVECPHCGVEFNPQEGPAKGQYVVSRMGEKFRIKELLAASNRPPRHRLYALMALRGNGEKIYLAPSKDDLSLYEEAEALLASEELPLPTSQVRPGHNTDQARGYNYNSWRDFFNARQLLCLGYLLQDILKLEDIPIQEQLLCLFSSTLEFNNMFCSFKGEGTGAVRHMFSNHILKPERTPLENSVWGTDRSSGTFSTLFESRLIRAKRYLDDPFELKLEMDSSGRQVGTTKVKASNPIRARLANSWEDLQSGESGVLVLNGDSSRLPVPSKTIDAVITDPPYFDFVHYSELSDFFFAWLSPALKKRYSWLDREDSSDSGEVQQKAPRKFAQQLGLVFKDCVRVLKDDGVLAFSFHHSRAEGWAAIYEALTAAGLAVVSAHTVHAELRSASPKSAAKEPISLDAILVCRKQSAVSGKEQRGCDSLLAQRVAKVAAELESAGLSISAGDRFVIAAAQTIIDFSFDVLSFDEIQAHLEVARRIADQDCVLGSNDEGVGKQEELVLS